MGKHEPRDFIEWLDQPSGIIRIGGDGVTFEASATFDVRDGVATVKGGVAKSGAARLTREHMRRAKELLTAAGLKVRWVHKLREHNDD